MSDKGGHIMKTRYFCAAYVLLALLYFAGCSQSDSNTPEKQAQPSLAGVKLTLAVAGDPELASAIIRLQGEWNSQTGAELQVLQIAEKELGESETLSADAVICAPRFIVPFAEKNLIVPVPASMQKTAEWADIFDLPRQQEVCWGKEIMAVPFGSPVFVVYYRNDLFEKLNRKPPQTWTEYFELANALAEMKKSTPDAPWFGTMEPLGKGWAGLVLLARAASYAKHRDNYSTLFNIKTMAPLLAGPPLVRALEELVAAAKLGSADALKSDPVAVREAFWQGKCGMTISWPSAADRQLAEKITNVDGTSISAGFIAMPGSNKVFNINNQKWEARSEDENPGVPFAGIAGRVGMVSKRSTQQEAAFKLLLWLSGGQNGPQICPYSPATTIFRRSQLKQPMPWVEKAVAPAAAAKYAELTEKTMHREQCLDLRIPGREDYLATLDDAVQSAVRGDVSPADALSKTAERWREITEKLGVEKQRAAYLHSLGLE
jgi:multiple sugar transport system substrate-binding protein